MFGVKCKRCKEKFKSDYILTTEKICVYCKYKTNKFYYNGDLLTKQEAIKKNQMFEKLVKEENRKYRRYRCL